MTCTRFKFSKCLLTVHLDLIYSVDHACSELADMLLIWLFSFGAAMQPAGLLFSQMVKKFHTNLINKRRIY